jgi:hypothetical protein
MDVLGYNLILNQSSFVCSKILSRYYKTGLIDSIDSSSIGSIRRRSSLKNRQLSHLVVWKIMQIKREMPTISAENIRHQLVFYRLYDRIEFTPTVDMIDRIVVNPPINTTNIIHPIAIRLCDKHIVIR